MALGHVLHRSAQPTRSSICLFNQTQANCWRICQQSLASLPASRLAGAFPQQYFGRACRCKANCPACAATRWKTQPETACKAAKHQKKQHTRMRRTVTVACEKSQRLEGLKQNKIKVKPASRLLQTKCLNAAITIGTTSNNQHNSKSAQALCSQMTLGAHCQIFWPQVEAAA